jgi:hypothetical protein
MRRRSDWLLNLTALVDETVVVAVVSVTPWKWIAPEIEALAAVPDTVDVAVELAEEALF